MSAVTPEKAFDRAMDLVLHADDVAHKWMGRLIAVQTSLVIAEGALLTWKGDQGSVVITAIAVLIGLVAIIVLLGLSHIVIREHDHGHAYIAMVKRAEGTEPFLFRDGDPRIPGPRFARVIGGVKWTLLVAWALLLIILVRVAVG